MVQSLTNRIPTQNGVGEVVERDFIRVVFQSGFPQDVGINGCRPEDVAQLLIERLKGYQSGPLSCEENDEALLGLRTAVQAMVDRRRRREEQGVLNTMSRHETIRTEDWHDDFSATGA